MAPKRQRKTGMKRIDAAIDALVPYGFTKGTIRSTIMKLLKVYDDAAAWRVIEEDTYRLVIDTILEDQEQEDKEHQQKKVEVETRASEVAGTETNNALQLYVKDQGQSSSAAREAEPRPPLDSDCQENLLDSSCPACRQSQPNQLSSSRPRRLPCYGWLSETESDSEDTDGPPQLATEVRPVRRVRKRPTGWDVKPSDL